MLLLFVCFFVVFFVGVNDAVITFCLRLYGVRYTRTSQLVRKPAAALTCCLGVVFCCCFLLGFFYAPFHRIAHTTAFVSPVVEHWLEREIAQWVHYQGSIR